VEATAAAERDFYDTRGLLKRPNRSCARIAISEELRAQVKTSKFQIPKKHPAQKTNLCAVCLGIWFWGLVFEIWSFPGAWGLVLGASLNGYPADA